MITRRSLAAVAALLATRLPALATGGPNLGPPAKVTYESLGEEARAASLRPYVRAQEGPPGVLDALDYDAHGKVRSRVAGGLYAGSTDPVTFFHLGKMFRRPVRVYELDGSTAREVLYARDMFEIPPGNPASAMPDGAGFAGFRVHEAARASGGEEPDWLAFLGASYFRSAGDGGQYGISARGVAVDTAPAPGGHEDFPDFTRFYVGPYVEGEGMTILAYLDGAGVTGAYRFRARRHPRVVIDVDCAIYPRRPVARLGIAPLTSMFWFSETNKWISPEWRDEVHDSDGLAIHAGTGEQIWRPLNNPPQVAVSAFRDRSPRGFGLLQRDRDFDHYRDDVRFELRPDLWIEPRGDWGPGSVQLVEIPTGREYDDNIVAMWVPDRPAGRGDEFAQSYRMSWGISDPMPGPAARCVATRMSKVVETPEAERVPGRVTRERQYVLDFRGDALKGRNPREAEVVMTCSRGQLGDVGAWPDGDGTTGRWRVFFKLFATGAQPVDLRLHLRQGGETLSETWVGQSYPEQHVA